jgi:hypothetical protein
MFCASYPFNSVVVGAPAAFGPTFTRFPADEHDCLVFVRAGNQLRLRTTDGGVCRH